jgi:hypothetical protein
VILTMLVVVLSFYFGVLLVPHWWPAFGASPYYIVYLLTLPLTLVGLIILATSGAVGALAARRRGTQVGVRHRTLLLCASVGLVMFAATIGLERRLGGTLPRGSFVLEFSTPAWQDPAAAAIVPGDITPRQKMLGSVVARLTPALDRPAIEALLGRSLDTPHFKSTGRDLIYVLGPERGLGVDSQWLLIWLDASGHFARYQVVTD